MLEVTEAESLLIQEIQEATSNEVKLSKSFELEKLLEDLSKSQGLEYTRRMFEILEWKFREIPKNEAELFFKDPASFPDAVQRKYCWILLKDWKKQESFIGSVPVWYELINVNLQNPFTFEKYSINRLQKIPEISIEERIQTIKNKIANWTATATEKNDLQLLIW